MIPHYEDPWLTIYIGDARTTMADIEPASVHMVCTSPPYWGLRSYLSGDDPDKVHELGLEATPEAYVAAMVDVFRGIWRVLRADGTVWVNLGDSYAASNASGPQGLTGGRANRTFTAQTIPKMGDGLKPKDLVGIPWMVAFALRADGWFLRSDIIWSKPNPMPESVTDRPTKSHEYLFLLSKSPTYYFDAEAVREAQTDWTSATGSVAADKAGVGSAASRGLARGITNNHTGRNIRSVWSIATQPYPGAHFATFPRKLVEPCIKAGTSERGVCPECGAPWLRETSRSAPPPVDQSAIDRYGTGEAGIHRKVGGQYQKWLDANPTETTGWRPTCAHYPRTAEWPSLPSRASGEDVDAYEVRIEPQIILRAELIASWQSERHVPATVLDPFAGSGTVGMVAQSLSRRAVLIDLSPDYLLQQMKRNAAMPLGL